ncbi:MAG TPA: HD domain-containing protein [Bacteroidales bacterium]|nr:HD domain-containing protein [Bacteroidales bacterium]
MNRNIIKSTEDFVKEQLSGVESGHDWWHIQRVRKLAMHINSIEQDGDPIVIELASLLHDVGDDKIASELNGTMLVGSFLTKEGIGRETKEKVLHIMENISFRDSFNGICSRTAELNIVQDADRLDAIGAIGIARAFNYGGSAGNAIYEPGNGPREYRSKDEYTGSDSSTINHFYEKLLKLKDMMNTETGKRLAEERHDFMLGFLDQFIGEWNLDE